MIPNLLLSNAEIKEYKVQHHEAHFAAILGEHQLWESKEEILGVIWDGTGFNSLQEIWGSEFFTYKNNQIKHISQLENFSWILGDKMSKSPKISALSLSENNRYLSSFFTENEWKIYTKLINEKTVKTSSMGRVFDAVSFILGYQQPVYFEGEAAMWLEKLASQAYYHQPETQLTDYLAKEKFNHKIPIKKLMKIIISESETEHIETIALNFHCTLIKVIEKIAVWKNSKHIAFSGGVFQNSVLLDLAIQILKPNFKLYFHEKLSPNDENISFGQLNYYLNIQALQ
jgi:hydrogenase maturation protein HypF